MKKNTVWRRLLASCTLSLAGLGAAQAALPIEHWQQSSGAQIYLVRSPSIPMVDVQIDFDAGSRRDPSGQAGLAAAVASMAARGVLAADGMPALDENELGAAWADLGAALGVNASADSSSYSLRSLTEAALLDAAAQLAARQLAQPAYPEAVWRRQREQWIAALREADTRPATQAARAFRQALYPHHPYGVEVTAETLARIGVADLQAFHRRHILACRAKVSVVGALDRAQTDALVQTLLSRLPAHADCPSLPELPAVTPVPQELQRQLPFAAAQAQVLIGQIGIKRSDPDFLALLVGNYVLGGGDLVSRLMNELREKRGLTYGVSSSFSPALQEGPFVIRVQTRPDQAAQAVAVAREVLQRFVREGPTEAELQAAKAYLIGGFALRLDSNAKLLGNVANIAWNGLPLDYLDHWTQQVQALSTADIKAAFQRHLQPERMVTVVLGAQAANTPARTAVVLQPAPQEVAP